MKLHHKTYFEHQQPSTASKSTMVIIPGLFGSVGNWRGFANKISEYAPVVVIDQRNHGLSAHSPSNSYFDLAADLLELLDQLGIAKATLCGHSMGGKTAMVFALSQPQRVDQLVVLDIAPVSYSNSHATVLEALQSVDLSLVNSRAEVEQQLVSSIPDKSTRLFVMMSLAKEGREFRWRLNIGSLYDNLHLISGFPRVELLGAPFHGKCLFVKGSESSYVELQYYDAIYDVFPKAIIETIKDAGHWLHIDQQSAVIAQMLNFLENE